MHADCLIINIGQLHSLANSGKARFGKEMEDTAVIYNAAIAIKDGCIIDIGNSTELERKYTPSELIDANGMLALPGFVVAIPILFLCIHAKTNLLCALPGKAMWKLPSPGVECDQPSPAPEMPMRRFYFN